MGKLQIINDNPFLAENQAKESRLEGVILEQSPESGCSPEPVLHQPWLLQFYCTLSIKAGN